MRILTGIKPSGKIHIGNYIGAIKPILDLEKKNDEIFLMVADLHAQTLPYKPLELKENTLDLVASLLAFTNPKKTIIFLQSQVPQHAQLSWIFSTITPLGELYRMIQFKEKSKEFGSKGAVGAGLLIYPVLQAADVLLYQPYAVPVGKDQEQHLELTRTIARKFNTTFGDVFKIPKTLSVKEGAKIYSLTNPNKKMSKSENDPKGAAYIFDSPKNTSEKFRQAVTDSGKEVVYRPSEKPAISNLLVILSIVSKKPIKQLEKEFKNKGYKEFKETIAEFFVSYFAKVKKEKEALLKNPQKLKKIIEANAKKAQKSAQKTLDLVYKKTGLVL